MHRSGRGVSAMIGEPSLDDTVARLERRVDALERALASRPAVVNETPPATGASTFGQLRFQGLLALVAAEFNVPVGCLTGPLRHDWMIRPRFTAQWIVRRASTYSYPQIGRLFGRDHSSIMSACRRVEAMRAADADYRDVTDRLLAVARTAIADGSIWRLK